MHKHTHLQAAQSQTHGPKLAKECAFCHSSTDRQPKRPRIGQQITRYWRDGG